MGGIWIADNAPWVPNHILAYMLYSARFKVSPRSRFPLSSRTSGSKNHIDGPDHATPKERILNHLKDLKGMGFGNYTTA